MYRSCNNNCKVVNPKQLTQPLTQVTIIQPSHLVTQSSCTSHAPKTHQLFVYSDVGQPGPHCYAGVVIRVWVKVILQNFLILSSPSCQILLALMVYEMLPTSLFATLYTFSFYHKIMSKYIDFNVVGLFNVCKQHIISNIFYGTEIYKHQIYLLKNILIAL